MVGYRYCVFKTHTELGLWVSLTDKAKRWIEAAAADQKVDIPRDRQDLYDLLKFEPRSIQAQSLGHTMRFACEVWHRRAGKSYSKVIKLIDRAHYCPFPQGRYAYLAPTYSQAEDIAWSYLTDFADMLPWHDPNRDVEKSKLAVWFPSVIGNRSRVRLYGVDSVKQRLRGSYLDGGIADEFQDMPMSVWTEQARPMLSDSNRSGFDAFGRRNQWFDFIGTPKGRNQLHTMFQKASLWHQGKPVMEEDPITGRLEPVISPDWYAALHKASETGILAKAELRSALAEMGHSKYQQEYECSFDAAVEGSIYGSDLENIRRLGRVTNFDYNPNVPVNTAWDLGWDDATFIWFFQQVGPNVMVIDCIQTSGASIPLLVQMLREKPYHYGYHLLPWDVGVTELGSGKSRISIFKECGLRPTVGKKANPYDRIEAGRQLLYNAYFNEGSCLQGLDMLALYRREFDERTQTFRETPRHDQASHAADAWGELGIGVKNTFSYGHNQDRPERAEL